MGSKVKCCTCGKEWINGQDSSHSCSLEFKRLTDEAIKLLEKVTVYDSDSMHNMNNAIRLLRRE